MRWWIAGALAASVTSVGCAHADDMNPAWNWTFSNETQYVTWSANRGFPYTLAGPAHGFEVYNPVSASLTGTPLPNWNVEIDGRGGYVHAGQTAATVSGSVSTATDTTLSGTATYTGFTGWQPYVTLMANLPTGMSVLSNTRTFARMDPDIVPVAIFGEGFNLGPTVGVNLPFNSDFTMVVSGGYTWRGAYWKEGGFNPFTMMTAAPDLINPSNVWTGALTASYHHDALTLQGTASYARETINYVNHAISYRLGPRTTLSGVGSYAWNKSWTTSIDGYVVHIDKNDIPTFFLAPSLSEEMLDSNNNIYRINVRHMYSTPFYAGTLTIGPMGSYMYRANNSWDPNSFVFVPAKSRYSAGLSASYAPNGKMSLTAHVERVWIRENIDLPLGIPVVDGNGWLAVAGLTFTGP